MVQSRFLLSYSLKNMSKSICTKQVRKWRLVLLGRYEVDIFHLFKNWKILKTFFKNKCGHQILKLSFWIYINFMSGNASWIRGETSPLIRMLFMLLEEYWMEFWSSIIIASFMHRN